MKTGVNILNATRCVLFSSCVLIAAALLTPGCRTTPQAESTAAVIACELASTNEAGVVSGHDAAYEEIELLVETLLLVKRNYVEEQSFRDLLYGAINGMLLSLDPHSTFLVPEAYEALQEDAQGSFCGIGVTIGVQSGMLTVIAPIEDSPAFKLGLLAGDRIAAIEDATSADMTVDQAVTRLRGSCGTPVCVTIQRAGMEPFDVTIVREEIRLTSVKGARLMDDGFGYLRITQFGEKTPSEFIEAWTGLTGQGLRGLVVDLRGNPGGLLDSAVEVAQNFLPAKSVVVSIRGRQGSKQERIFYAQGRQHDIDLPLVVLINRGSASAAEIVAGALQDHNRAVIVGETSFGKASVQNVIPVQTRPTCAVKLTTSHYFTPSGRLIDKKGINPDESVPMDPGVWRQVQLKRLYEEMPDAYPVATRESVADTVDTQLEKAIALLHDMMPTETVE